MATTGAGVRPDVTLKLSQLQNLCKRDPQGHRTDYDAQIRRLQSECHILSLSPSAKPPSQLSELIQFAAAVSSSSYDNRTSDMVANLLVCLLLGKSYDAAIGEEEDGSTHDKTKTQSTQQVDYFKFASVIMSLPTSALNLHRDVRKSCVSALILMRNKGRLPPLKLLELFFRIMAVIPDKGMREQLYKHIVNDVRNINKKGKKDEKVNRSVQTFLHKVIDSTVESKKNNLGNGDKKDIDDATQFAAKKAVEMTAELYRRKVWNDERTVAILGCGVESVVPNVAAACMRFFLGIEEKMADDEEKETNEEWNGAQQIDYHLYSRKTKKRAHQVKKQVKNKVKQQQKRELELDSTDYGVEASRKLYPAIELLRDPQGLAESVLKRIQKTGSSFRFQHKVLAINFVTRLVGNHELLLLPLYPFLRRYMGGQQRDVTQILAYTVQACHDRVPPEEIHGLLKTIAHNFITERCTGEQMAVGINACRAICARSPSSLVPEDSNTMYEDESGLGTSSISVDVEAFVRDLAGYSKHRDRSVAVAGRSWTNFIREVHPSLLQGKDRGTTGSALHRAGEKPLRYGEERISSGVAGADLLVEYEAKKAAYLRQKMDKNVLGEDISSDASGDSDGIEFERMNDEVDSNGSNDENDSEGWVDVDGSEDDEEDDNVEEGMENEEQINDNSDNEKAPTLVPVKIVDGKAVPISVSESKVNQSIIDLASMTQEQRAKLNEQISSTRVFTAEDFEKMRKLVEREERIKRDPRAAARLKRRRAQGREFEELSDDDSDDDSDEEARIYVKGAVNTNDIMADAKRKRANKMERLEKVLAGREAFEHKKRDGGSTNTEKKRKKNFLMSKFSMSNRTKQGSKDTARRGTLKKQKKNKLNKHENKKRRRKL